VRICGYTSHRNEVTLMNVSCLSSSTFCVGFVVCLSVRPSVCPSVRLSVCLSVYYDFVLHSGGAVCQENHALLFVCFLDTKMLRSRKDFIEDCGCTGVFSVVLLNSILR
jgi:hypothetical protein